MRLMCCHIGAGDPEYQIPFYLYDCNKVILLSTANLSNNTIKMLHFDEICICIDGLIPTGRYVIKKDWSMTDILFLL